MDRTWNTLTILGLVVAVGIIYTGIEYGEYFMPVVVVIAFIAGIGASFGESWGCSYWWLMWIPYFKRRYAINKCKRELDELGIMPPYLVGQVEDPRVEIREILSKLEEAQDRLGMFENADFEIPYEYRF